MPLPNFHVAVAIPRSRIIGDCRTKTAEMHNKEVLQTHCQFKDPNGNTAWAMQRVLFDRTIWQPAEVKAICDRQGWKFEKAKSIQKSDLPEGEFVRRRQIIESENGSAIFVKCEPDPDSEYPVIQGKVSKRGLEDYEYLLHHIHIGEGEEERIDHCLLFDHLGNAFELEHLKQEEETYHVVKGLESSQDVAWSDEQAREEEIEPKKMKKGMSFPEKADEW